MSLLRAQSSFKDVGASDEMVKALRSIGIERPSFIQAAAYQVLMSGARHIVLADHAGAAFHHPSASLVAHSLLCPTLPAVCREFLHTCVIDFLLVPPMVHMHNLYAKSGAFSNRLSAKAGNKHKLMALGCSALCGCRAITKIGAATRTSCRLL